MTSLENFAFLEGSFTLVRAVEVPSRLMVLILRVEGMSVLSFDGLSLGALVFVFLAALGLLPLLLLGLKALVRPGDSVARKAVSSYEKEAEQLSVEAGQQLLRADEIVSMARDELAFAQASFGQVRTQSFSELISAGEQALTEAFRIQSSLGLLTAAKKSEAARTILSLLSQRIPPIVEAQKGFVTQRDAQASVEIRAARVQELAGELRKQLPVVAEKLRSLSLEYSAEALRTVAVVPEQVGPLLSSAEQAGERALASASSERAVAVQAIETAERALRLAQAHVDSVFAFDSSVERSLDALSAGIGSLTADLGDVESLRADTAAFAPLVAAARQAIEAAHLARDGQGNPVEALSALTQAEADIDAALAPLREAREVRERSQVTADRYIEAAHHAIRQARHVSSSAGNWDSGHERRSFAVRQRLREAEQLLSEAESLRVSDPDKAIEKADRAASLARQATHSDGNGVQGLPGGFAGSMGNESIDFESLAADFLRSAMRTSRYRRW